MQVVITPSRVPKPSPVNITISGDGRVSLEADNIFDVYAEEAFALDEGDFNAYVYYDCATQPRMRVQRQGRRETYTGNQCAFAYTAQRDMWAQGICDGEDYGGPPPRQHTPGLPGARVLHNGVA